MIVAAHVFRHCLEWSENLNEHFVIFDEHFVKVSSPLSVTMLGLEGLRMN